MRGPTAFHALVFLALVSLAGCSTHQATRPAPSFPAACTLLPAPYAGADTITVAVPQHTSEGKSIGDPLLLRQLYETLITVDCLGTARPALAEAWNGSADEQRWTFVLREDARFWDGAPVTAHHVVASWQETVARHPAVDSVTTAGERTVHVYLRWPHSTAPPLLASPDFAVTMSHDAHPLGSGPYRVDLPAGTPSSRPMIQTVNASTHDLRDLLSGTVDVLITSDPNVIRYATQRPHLAARPLPWNIMYVLVSPSRSHARSAGSVIDSTVWRLGDGLARDAVRTDARAAQPLPWWDELQDCGMPSPDDAENATRYEAPDQPTQARRILYAADDPVARGLAERLVALASMDTTAVPDAAALAAAVPDLVSASSAVTATGVASRKLDQHLAEGNDMAYVIALPRRPYDPCAEADTLLRRIPWLAPLRADLPDVLIPLVDTRPHVIARTDRLGLAVDGYGNLLFLPEATEE